MACCSLPCQLAVAATAHLQLLQLHIGIGVLCCGGSGVLRYCEMLLLLLLESLPACS
jgi:hypothetical protein